MSVFASAELAVLEMAMFIADAALAADPSNVELQQLYDKAVERFSAAMQKIEDEESRRREVVKDDSYERDENYQGITEGESIILDDLAMVHLEINKANRLLDEEREKKFSTLRESLRKLDALEQRATWFDSASTEQELVKAREEYDTLSRGMSENDWKGFLAYCKSYPVDDWS
jgi:hypothetical protein